MPAQKEVEILVTDAETKFISLKKCFHVGAFWAAALTGSQPLCELLLFPVVVWQEQQQQGCNTAGDSWKPFWFTGVAAHSTVELPLCSSEGNPVLRKFLFPFHRAWLQNPWRAGGFPNTLFGGWGCAKAAPGLAGSADAGLGTQQDPSLQPH